MLALSLAVSAQGASRYFADRAGAPVQWQRWGSAAFARAKTEKRPIFLSIGFASSNECYRMHREAFLNGENAESLNTYFVPVLLDRVEYPEVAEAYEAAAKAMSGVTEWPVNLVLNAQLEPFAAAGAMKSDELGRFLVLNANRFSKGETARYQPPSPARPAAPPDVEHVVDAIAKSYDAKDGGFGGVPRRLHPMTISFLLRYAARAKHEGIRGVAIDSLQKMSIAPVRDQLAGGFHRGTRDAALRDPYFEKMLPDQALMTIACLDAYQATNDPELAFLARTTLDSALRDMRAQRGPFDASQDAYNFVPLNGPELINGNFYLWQKDEITRLVGREPANKIFTIYAMKDAVPNLPALAEWRFLHETHDTLAAPLAKMLEVRLKRPEPSREFNVITGWNGLMISALARAGAQLSEPLYVTAATDAAAGLTRTHWNAKTKTLLHSEGVEALAEDYAMLVQGLLDLYEAGSDIQWLELAITLQQRQDQLFWDGGSGAYATGASAPAPVRALVRETDNETPSANSVSASNLLRLAALTGNAAWRERPAIIFAAFGGRMLADGAELPQLANALELARVAPSILVVVGDVRLKSTYDLMQSYRAHPDPMRAYVFVPDKGLARDRVVRTLPFTGALTADLEPGKSVIPVAYLCANGECKRR
jgi:uncharacterized protein YyaL (SSP411 family)